jgi:hypothetical protein
MTKLMSIFQAAAVILFCAAFPAGAQAQAVAGDLAAAAPFSADALDQLLRPIALYPDPLLAEIFAAATVPAQIVMADRYVNSGGDPNQAAEQPWDPSVQALVHYPTVLKWLDDNLPWTTEVGEAFLNQQQDVMASIQHLRMLAQAQNNLRSTLQENVVSDGGNIEILPANSDEIYVPTYPWNTIYYDAGVFCSFGVGFPIGLWLTHDWDWRNHHLFTWGPGHARPVNWWSQPPRNRVAPRGVAIWQAPARASAGVARNTDRGFSADAFRPSRLTAPATPASAAINRPATSPQASRPGTVPGFSSGFTSGATPPVGAGAAPSGVPSLGPRPPMGVGSPGNFAVAPMTGRPAPTGIPSPGTGSSFGVGSPPMVSRPAPDVRAPSGGGASGGGASGGGAFGGSESSFEARQSSARGVESRSTMSAPAAAPSSSGRSAPASAPAAAPSAPARSYSPPSSSQPSQSSGSSRGR